MDRFNWSAAAHDLAILYVEKSINDIKDWTPEDVARCYYTACWKIEHSLIEQVNDEPDI